MWLRLMNSSSGTGWSTGSLAAAHSLASPSWTMTSTLIGRQRSGWAYKHECRTLSGAAMCLAAGLPSKTA